VKDPSASSEYRLRIERTVSPSTRRPCTLVALSTVKAFTSFRYGLTVEDVVDGTRLRLRVLGLDAPHLNLPGSGPAEFVREYEHLTGECTIDVTGIDGKTTSVRCSISAEGVSLLAPVTGAVSVDLPDSSKKKHPPSP
jgi:hypothetical protein